MSDTRNYDITGKYFDLVQNEIKKLISEDKTINPNQVEEFNKSIFQQGEEVENQIREYIDKAASNNLDIKKVAQIIYDRFKLQVKNNDFNQDKVNDIPNQLMGEKKHIKSFEQFCNEGSMFHTQEQIDEILQKINDEGYESLDQSEKAILMNFSKDDEDIHEILVKANNLTKKFKELNKELEILNRTNPEEAKEKFKKEWMQLNTQMRNYEMTLRHLYNIEDPNDIYLYQQKHGLTAAYDRDDYEV